MGIMICPECGGKVSTTRTSCFHCGYDFTCTQNKFHCPECNAEIDQNVTVCPECGYNLKEQVNKTNYGRKNNQPDIVYPFENFKDYIIAEDEFRSDNMIFKIYKTSKVLSGGEMKDLLRSTFIKSDFYYCSRMKQAVITNPFTFIMSQMKPIWYKASNGARTIGAENRM